MSSASASITSEDEAQVSSILTIRLWTNFSCLLLTEVQFEKTGFPVQVALISSLKIEFLALVGGEQNNITQSLRIKLLVQCFFLLARN